MGKFMSARGTSGADRSGASHSSSRSSDRGGSCAQFVTDKLRSYGAALRDLGAADRQEAGRWLSNRAENSHLPFRRRERAMLRFRRMRNLQKFASVQASVTNNFNQERSLSSRPLFKASRDAPLAEWRGLCAA
jgi:putative transposase